MGPARPRRRGLRPRVSRRPHADGGVAVNIASVREVGSDLLDAVETVIVGKRPVLERVLWAILGDGHLLIEDVPGLAKTLIAKSFAAGWALSFRRIQFTPDLLPADITGTYVFDRKTGDFVLRRGPVFTNVLLADEINRAPPKTQSALLEAMQERQATLEGETFPLDRPFFVIATQNPIEHEGTYPLPEAQVDRFLLRIDVGYPSREEEVEILERRRKRRSDDATIEPVTTPDQVRALQAAIEDVHVDPAVEGYMVDIVVATRGHSQVEVGASPRGSLALLKVARARAAIAGRDFVTPDDVKTVAGPALAHRLIRNEGSSLDLVEIADILPRELAVIRGTNHAVVSLEKAGTLRLAYTVRSQVKGDFVLGPVRVRSFDPLALGAHDVALDLRSPLVVAPAMEDLRRAQLQPRRTRPWFGQVPSRRIGPGTEFWGLREYVAGDEVRRINWKASARLERLFTNEYEGERSGDVVIVVDARRESFVGTEADNPVEHAVRAALGIADRVLATKNRVGLIVYRQVIDWVPLAFGRKQLYRILDHLVHAKPGGEWRVSHVGLVLSRFLPRDCLIVLITPLQDRDALTAVIGPPAPRDDTAQVSPPPPPSAPRDRRQGPAGPDGPPGPGPEAR